MKKRLPPLAIAALVPWLLGFNLSTHSVHPEETLDGSPPKDAIPAIIEPRFVAPDDATLLSDDDRAAGVAQKGVAKPPAAAEPETRLSAEAAGIQIVSHEGYWVSLSGGGLAIGMVDDEEDAGSFYVIAGEIRNTSPVPVGFVKLSYELVDDLGAVVFHEQGYNLAAETLRDTDEHSAAWGRAVAALQPIPPGASDSFRMFFLHGEVPRFASYRTQVQAVRPPIAGSRSPQPPAAPRE